ncbi:MAG: glycosyltransferase, partial [Candidatus Omnitrophica bacterium]|nr:glycosyltransferase [Candidatus Omnitrophota bacterium]
FIIEVRQPEFSLIYKIFSKLNQFYSREDFLKKVLRQIERPGGIRKIFTGREKYNCLDVNTLIRIVGFTPDIIHFHNIRDNLLGPDLIKSAAVVFPVVITLHDLWLLTGKCIQPGRCNGWKNKCSNCHESWFPSRIIKRGIKNNLEEKIEIISKTKPYICVPSSWAAHMVKNSYIEKVATEIRTIHNGIDLSIYRPGDKTGARKKLNLPDNKFVLLSSGRDLKTNRYKNFKAIKEVSFWLGHTSVDKKIIFLCLGDKGKTTYHGNLEMRFFPFTTNEIIVADMYRAADVYVHTGEYETWGLTVTEAMACGVPVVAFASGAVSEQIIDGKTGFLIKENNTEGMADTIIKLLENKELRESISEAAFKHAKENFDIKDTALKYIEFYKEILEKNESSRH